VCCRPSDCHVTMTTTAAECILLIKYLEYNRVFVVTLGNPMRSERERGLRVCVCGESQIPKISFPLSRGACSKRTRVFLMRANTNANRVLLQKKRDAMNKSICVHTLVVSLKAEEESKSHIIARYSCDNRLMIFARRV
jgi:hypothetical protein